MVPKTSTLRPEVTLSRPLDDIRKVIEKLIPPGTPEADAHKLRALHLPKEVREQTRVNLPDDLRKKPHTCYRLIDSTSVLHLGRQWVEALFFFEIGKLKRIHVGLGRVVL